MLLLLLQQRTHAARVIQRHYRRHLSSKTRREKDLKALLALKKMEKQVRLLHRYSIARTYSQKLLSANHAIPVVRHA